MTTVIINATNLLGDSIYTLQPIKDYLDGVDTGRVLLVSDRGLVHQMFIDTFPKQNNFDNIDVAIKWAGERWTGEDMIQIRLDAGSSGHICHTSARETGKQLHISEGFAQMLGITLREPVMPYAPWNNWEPNRRADALPVVGISPFSRSCSRHSGERANKTLDDHKWITLLQFLRMHFNKVVVIAGPNDRLTGVGVSEDEYWTATSFDALRGGLKDLTMLVTVDNGISHLASVLDVPTIILWPQVSNQHFIAPLWAPKTGYIGPIDPPTIQASVLLTGLRELTKKVINKEV